jgi:hypothetical protein
MAYQRSLQDMQMACMWLVANCTRLAETSRLANLYASHACKVERTHVCNFLSSLMPLVAVPAAVDYCGMNDGHGSSFLAIITAGSCGARVLQDCHSTSMQGREM